MKLTNDEANAALYITLDKLGLIHKDNKWCILLFTEILRNRKLIRKLKLEWHEIK